MEDLTKTNCSLGLSVLIVVLPLLASGQSANSAGPLYKDKILRTLVFPADSKATKFETNKELIEIIRKRGARFLLNDKTKKELRDAGASEELLNVIETCLTPCEKGDVVDESTPERKRLREMIRLEDQIRELWGKSDIQSRKLLIEVVKEFLKKFGNEDEDDAQQMASYLRAVLPKLERKLERLIELTRSPKIN